MPHYHLQFSAIVILISAVTIVTIGSAYAVSEHAVEVTGAWIAEAPPVSKVQAGYMTIHNRGAGKQIITEASSPCFERIEFHRTVHEDGMAKMVQQHVLAVAPYDNIKLERGGLHMMLYTPMKKLTAGDHCMFTLKTADKQQYDIEVTVKKADGHDHHHHNH